MKDEIWQKRQFILSSFCRLKITLCSNVHKFVDHMIMYDYIPTDNCLNQVDAIIRQEYYKYLNNG
jgi:hypothetical protein